MKIRIAYLEEPPFGWSGPNGAAMGADIDLATVVLRAIGATEIEHRLTTFSELLDGVATGRWDMNVPLFITPERAQQVAFSVPVWAMADGFLVRTDNDKALDSYASVAERRDARLGIIAGQVQHESARAAGVSEDQIVVYQQQAEAIEAVRAGTVDAYASTALGNRILAERIGGSVLRAVEHRPVTGSALEIPFGAFSFSKNSNDLRHAVNRELRSYLGSAAHREQMARFGFTHKEIDPVLSVG
ncbi:transporter substrate-binding domain-containing protein [Paraburkholderia caledonica]|uniref:transporter substrate-binding domain-containing protein n=1 Tax=Paraburkholderia caledonica TaxID=134536 RepID=UPI000484176A|nr:transporter substrate-binding domain-containing protein [Paraburkholderia caledonica]